MHFKLVEDKPKSKRPFWKWITIVYPICWFIGWVFGLIGSFICWVVKWTFKIITSPFVLLFWIIKYPFRKFFISKHLKYLRKIETGKTYAITGWRHTASQDLGISVYTDLEDVIWYLHKQGHGHYNLYREEVIRIYGCDDDWYESYFEDLESGEESVPEDPFN